MKPVFIIAAALGLAACASTDGNVTRIQFDPGGNIASRAIEIRHMETTGQRVEIVGDCMSACTMYLALPGTCVKPDARLGFHGPHKYGFPMSELDRFVGVAEMAAHYPPTIRGEFHNSWSLSALGGKTITGAEAHEMDPDHITLCEEVNT